MSNVYYYQGHSDVGYIGIISLPYEFLCGYWLFFSLFLTE